MAMCGRPKQGRAVIQRVMAQSVNTIKWWEGESEAANWFLHHTVLTSREFTGEPPDVSEDCLITTLTDPSPAYVAFVRALRALPAQQREAFLLFRGEHLDLRQAAVAMDCSTGAASTHQMAANKAMSTIAGETFNDRSAELMRVYATLTPNEDLIVHDVGAVGRRLRRKRFFKFVRQVILLALLAGVGYAIWKLSKMISI